MIGDALLRPLPLGLALVFGLGLLGCSQKPQTDQEIQQSYKGLIDDTDSETPPGPTIKPHVDDYPITGSVTQVLPDEKQIEIAHDVIEGFMDAMTMPFHVASEDLLEDVRVDDVIEGTLRVYREEPESPVIDYEIIDLVVAQPAPSAPLVIGADGRISSGFSQTLEIGQTVPNFTVTTQTGASLSLEDLRGRAVVLTFIYTRCPLPDFCPFIDTKMGRLAEAVRPFDPDGDRVRILSVSFDPEFDTPDVLQRHAGYKGATPPLWQFAVADHGELAKVAPALGLKYGPRPGEIVHNLCTAFIDPQGRLRKLDLGEENRVRDTDGDVAIVRDLIDNRVDSDETTNDDDNDAEPREPNNS